MTRFRGMSIGLLAVLVIGLTGSGVAAAGESVRHVVDATGIQARIDQQVDQEGASRQAIQAMLQRSDVREIAGRAGLDVDRASAAAAVLSGPELESLAAQVAQVDAGIGGSNTVVLSTTAIIIILLVIIILAD